MIKQRRDREGGEKRGFREWVCSALNNKKYLY